MKSVLLTRSPEDNHNIISNLKLLDLTNCYFDYICSPLVEYEDLLVNSTILGGYSNVIITSKFAGKIFASWFNDKESLNITSQNKPNIQIPQSLDFIPNIGIKKNIWLVGDSSKLLLLSKNITIKYIAENIADLIKNLPCEIYAETIYLSSNEITQDLPKEINRYIIYQVKYATELYQIEKIKKGIDYILIYSQNSAKALIKLLIKYNLLELLANSLVITISKKVADIIRFFSKNVVYCDNGKPSQMLELLIYNAKVRE